MLGAGPDSPTIWISCVSALEGRRGDGVRRFCGFFSAEDDAEKFLLRFDPLGEFGADVDAVVRCFLDLFLDPKSFFR